MSIVDRRWDRMHTPTVIIPIDRFLFKRCSFRLLLPLLGHTFRSRIEADLSACSIKVFGLCMYISSIHVDKSSKPDYEIDVWQAYGQMLTQSCCCCSQLFNWNFMFLYLSAFGTCLPYIQFEMVLHFVSINSFNKFVIKFRSGYSSHSPNSEYQRWRH